jgi:hypothetical protein
VPGIACGGPIKGTDTDGRFATASAMMTSAGLDRNFAQC